MRFLALEKRKYLSNIKEAWGKELACWWHNSWCQWLTVVEGYTLIYWEQFYVVACVGDKLFSFPFIAFWTLNSKGPVTLGILKQLCRIWGKHFFLSLHHILVSDNFLHLSSHALITYPWFCILVRGVDVQQTWKKPWSYFSKMKGLKVSFPHG